MYLSEQLIYHCLFQFCYRRSDMMRVF